MDIYVYYKNATSQILNEIKAASNENKKFVLMSLAEFNSGGKTLKAVPVCITKDGVINDKLSKLLIRLKQEQVKSAAKRIATIKTITE